MRLRSLLIAIVSLWPLSLRGQAPDLSQVPSVATPGDTSEVEDLVDDEEVLPRSETVPRSRDGQAQVAAIEAMQKEELSLSNKELRNRHTYAFSLALGGARPWQSYSLDAQCIEKPNLAYGLYAGSGSVRQPGLALSKTYSLKASTQVIGTSAREFFDRFDSLSVETLISFVRWNGSISPEGSREGVDDASAKLATSFLATGATLGFALNKEWIFENGVFLDWVIIGVRASRVFALDLGRESAEASRAIERDLERVGFFGLTDLRVGYLF